MEEYEGEWDWMRIGVAAAAVVVLAALAYFLFLQPGGQTSDAGGCAPFPEELDGFLCLASSEKNVTAEWASAGIKKAYEAKYARNRSGHRLVLSAMTISFNTPYDAEKYFDTYTEEVKDLSPGFKVSDYEQDGGRVVVVSSIPQEGSSYVSLMVFALSGSQVSVLLTMETAFPEELVDDVSRMALDLNDRFIEKNRGFFTL